MNSWLAASIGSLGTAPSTAQIIDVLPSSSNILSARIEHFEQDGKVTPNLLVTTADRRVHILDARAQSLVASHSAIHDSPVLSCSIFKNNLLTSSMSGQLHVSNLKGNTVVKRRDHSKYVVKVAVLEDGSSRPIIATAGWDSKILIYEPTASSDGSFDVGGPVSSITLQTKPEAMLFVRHPENNRPLLLVSRTDSNHVFFYTLETPPRLLGNQNLAPHSNAWVAFTPSAMELCPTDPTLLAVGTSSIPHMKLLILRLIFPRWDGAEETTPQQPIQSARAALLNDNTVGETVTETQASQARAALAIADREAAAVLIHCTTMAPQTAYSTPAVAWRPDGSGVWVNGDDGAVRGVEVSSGKVVSVLRDGHEAGSKIRCLWAGWVGGEEDRKEMLVSGGFDQRLIVWKA